MPETGRRQQVSKVGAALAKARLGVWALIFTVLAAAAPLTVIAGGATAGFAVTGSTGIPLGYVVVAVLLGVFSIGYVAMSRQIVNAGAFYTYITKGLGRPVGVAAAFVAVLAYNTMQTGLYGGFGVVLATFMSSEFGVSYPWWWWWALLGWLLILVLGGRRIEVNGLVLSVLLVAEIVVALVYAAVQVTHPAGGHLSYTTLSPGNLVGAGLGAALATAIAGFVGFEGTAVFSEETKNPQKTVARATYLALLIIGVAYGFCAWAMSVATGPDKIVARSVTDGSELIFNLAGPYVPAVLIFLGHLLFITSLFAALLAFHNTAARYFFALGREGVLWNVLGRTNPKTKAPTAGSFLQSGIGVAVIGLYALTGWDPYTKMFFWLTVLGGLGVLILMAVTSVAVLAYFTRRVNRRHAGVGRGVIAPAVAAVGLGGVLYVTVAQFAVLLGVQATSSLRWQLPALYAAAAMVGFGWALVLRDRQPVVYARIGRGAHSVVDEHADGPALRVAGGWK